MRHFTETDTENEMEETEIVAIKTQYPVYKGNTTKNLIDEL